MIMRFHKLLLAIFYFLGVSWVAQLPDCRWGWGTGGGLFFHCFEDWFDCFNNCWVFQICNRDGIYIIVVVAIHHGVIMLSIQWHDRQGACFICVNYSLSLSAKAMKQIMLFVVSHLLSNLVHLLGAYHLWFALHQHSHCFSCASNPRSRLLNSSFWCCGWWR